MNKEQLKLEVGNSFYYSINQCDSRIYGQDFIIYRGKFVAPDGITVFMFLHENGSGFRTFEEKEFIALLESNCNSEFIRRVE